METNHIAQGHASPSSKDDVQMLLYAAASALIPYAAAAVLLLFGQAS